MTESIFVNSRLRLVHITTVPMSLRFLHGQTTFMKSHGLEIHAVSSPGMVLEAFGREERIATHEIDMPRRITPLRDLRTIWRLIRTLHHIRPVIVHAHTPKGGLLGMISAWAVRTPVRIYHLRGLPYITATGAKRTLLKWTERVSCMLAHRVICVSHSIRDVAVNDCICSYNKIVVLKGGSGNGVDAGERFNPERTGEADRISRRETLGIRTDSLVIGFVGRLVRDKGIEELSRAWLILREKYLDIHLVLLGPLESQDPVSPETLDILRLDPRVHMVGGVDDSSSWYELFDLVVLPTYREGFPNVPLEAAAMELPVVATRIPGCIDAVEDGVTGTLVPPREVEPLADAIRRYLDNSELRAKHGKAGRARVLREFQQEAIWEAIYQEYCRLLTERGIPIPTPNPVTAPR